jgi:enoyl-CoA hydratase/carnithine racemase
MIVPELMMDLWCYTLGEQKAFQALQNAKLFSAKEALEENIVQEIAPADQVLDLAKKHLKKCLKVYGPVYIESKRHARKQLLAFVDRDLNQMVSEFIDIGKDPELKKRVQAFAAKLKQK